MEEGKVKEIKVRQKRGVPPLSPKDQKEAETFVREYANNIVDKWVNYFVRKNVLYVQTLKRG
ncbi:MAG: hypothetical protein MJZ32_05100 [Bacteroidaceae bacterium]|nr:hypothetical protein [Bacteroidaceae bacterium]